MRILQDNGFLGPFRELYIIGNRDRSNDPDETITTIISSMTVKPLDIVRMRMIAYCPPPEVPAIVHMKLYSQCLRKNRAINGCGTGALQSTI